MKVEHIEHIEVKDEHNYNENDVISARDRLKGALQDLVHHEDDETASSEDDNSRYKQPKRPIDSPSRTKTKKRRVDNAISNAFHHTYVMKLFDRSVDLAQFEEDTPLYPICRAWMANQPRNPHYVIKRRLSSPEPELTRLNINGDDDSPISDIHRLPPPAMELVNRIPSPLPEQIETNFDVDIFDNKNPPSREELMQGHQTRWVNVRRKWQDQAKKYEDRYFQSTAVLTAIYNKAQENMA
ncbi:protein lin-37 homolog [Chrysoperla carnea]|uniref:protein lin-37 homolog n=1 Tax=Chrysoperla carnea TaxID=189513 RepID=UPI001D06AF54|nr:protein lin-37 homolog [Chrysoperla carnea]